MLFTVKPVLSSHPREAQKWPLKAGGCLIEVNIRTKLKFGNIVYGCLRQVGCLKEVTANTGLTVVKRSKHKFGILFETVKCIK